MSTLWTERDIDILETLTRRVRILSLPQVARIWWPKAVRYRVIRRRLQKLAEAGLIERRLVNASLRPQPTAPLICWTPGDETPNEFEVSRWSRTRWERGTVSQEVVCASTLAANLFGCPLAGLPPVHHLDHELLLGDVFAHYRKSRPTEAHNWRGKVCFSGDGNIPHADAFLLSPEQAVLQIVKSAGRARPKAIAAFHTRLATAHLSYEIW